MTLRTYLSGQRLVWVVEGVEPEVTGLGLAHAESGEEGLAHQHVFAPIELRVLAAEEEMESIQGF